MIRKWLAWLRQEVRDAILGGVADATEELTGDQGDALERLRKYAAQVTTNGATAPRRNAAPELPQPTETGDGEATETAATGGRRRK
jgi:hypothetical protein